MNPFLTQGDTLHEVQSERSDGDSQERGHFSLRDNQQSFMTKKIEFENIVKKCDNYIDYSDSDNDEEVIER